MYTEKENRKRFISQTITLKVTQRFQMKSHKNEFNTIINCGYCTIYEVKGIYRQFYFIHLQDIRHKMLCKQCRVSGIISLVLVSRKNLSSTYGNRLVADARVASRFQYFQGILLLDLYCWSRRIHLLDYKNPFKSIISRGFL